MKKVIYLFLMVVLSVSCFDDFLTEEPETLVTNNNFWQNEKDVESAVYGMHRWFRWVIGRVDVHYRDRGLPFDNLGSWANISNNDLSRFTPDDPNTYWGYEYELVAEANTIADNIGRANMPQERYNFYLGQVLTIRAWSYFYIIRNWGDAPYIIHAEDVGERGRMAWQDIADAIIDDLKLAVGYLPRVNDLRDSEGRMIDSKQVPSRGTAFAIMAQVYAWKAALNNEPELNKLAIAACDSVIDSGSYALVGSIKDVCERVMLGNSEEGIFEIDYRNTEDDLKSGGSYLAAFCQSWPIMPNRTPATKRRGLRLDNTTVYKMYPDKSDQRREEYFYKLDSMAGVSTSITQGAVYVRKLRHILLYTSGSEIGQLKSFEDNEIIIRLADMILLRAELKAKTGDTDGAIRDLNRDRNRAGVRDYSLADGDLQDVIADERDRELFCEGISTRYFDIMRNGTFREKLRGNFKTLTEQDVADGALYYPVARQAFEDNTLMRQTSYWKRNGFSF